MSIKMANSILLCTLVSLLSASHLAAAFVPAAPDPYEDQFREWEVKYGREYNSEQERQARLKVFTENLLYIEQHNRAGHSYQLGVNQFADLTFEEFKTQHLMDPQHCSATHTGSPVKYSDPPKSIDWRQAGAVTPVKNQGQCGSCWTFSTTGCLESHHFLKTKQLVSLSEQQLVDCAQAFNNHGCEGGLPSQAFEYILYNKGLESEKAYPYKGENGKCRFSAASVAANVTGVVNITAGGEDELHSAVGTVGPVSIAFDVAFTFQFYHHGVYSSILCSSKPTHVNHAVLAVGYNTTESGEDYWIVKNSWGDGWGMDGYFWIARGKNMCGLADCASYPTV